jgi:hypothetical protein
MMLQTVYEIKVNGLEYLFTPFRQGEEKSQGSQSQDRRADYDRRTQGTDLEAEHGPEERHK